METIEFDINLPLRETFGFQAFVMASLANKWSGHPGAPCCDSDTTLQNWLDAFPDILRPYFEGAV